MTSRLCVFFCSFATLTSCAAGHRTVGLEHVLSVVDGDTIVVGEAGKWQEKVRVVGIDTPETVDPRKPVQCYGPQASKRMHQLLDGKVVDLQRKPDEDRDKYGRLLRYVSLNGKDIGAELIAEGFARNYPYFPHPRLSGYKALEKRAKVAKRGLWGACGKKT